MLSVWPVVLLMVPMLSYRRYSPTCREAFSVHSLSNKWLLALTLAVGKGPLNGDMKRLF